MERERPIERKPILSWFTIQSTPEGEAPEEIRKQWVGVTLAVREEVPASDKGGVSVLTNERVPMRAAVPVETEDAIIALRAAGRDEAADWWESNRDHGWEVRDTSFLLFEADCGEPRAA